MFSRQEGGPKAENQGRASRFRFLMEGTPAVLPHVDESRIIVADLDTLRLLIRSYFPVCSEFSDPMREKLTELGMTSLNSAES